MFKLAITKLYLYALPQFIGREFWCIFLHLVIFWLWIMYSENKYDAASNKILCYKLKMIRHARKLNCISNYVIVYLQ